MQHRATNNLAIGKNKRDGRAKWLALVFVILVVSTWYRTRGIPVTQEEFGEAWPFIQETAVLKCDGEASLAEIDGQKYALTVLGQAKGYPQIDSVLRGHPTLSGEKVSLALIADIAQKKCSGRRGRSAG